MHLPGANYSSSLLFSSLPGLRDRCLSGNRPATGKSWSGNSQEPCSIKHRSSDQFSGWAALLQVETSEVQWGGGTRHVCPVEDSQGEVHETGIRPFSPLCTRLILRSFSLSTWHDSTVKAVRAQFGAGLHKLGPLNFLQSVSAAGTHRTLCCPPHLFCIPILLTILQPRFEPRPEHPAPEGHLCTTTVIQDRELPGGQHLQAMSTALPIAKTTFPAGQLRKTLPPRHRRRNLGFLRKISLLVRGRAPVF